MSRAVAEVPRGGHGRLLAAIAVVFMLHVVAVVVLGNRAPLPVRQPAAAPGFQWRFDAPGQWAALEDPALFVLPRPEAVSGPAWMRIPVQNVQVQSWSEPPRWLDLPREQLGAALVEFARSHAATAFDNVAMPQPTEVFPMVLTLPLPTARSRLRLEGDLARRRMLTVPDLPSWSSTNLLTNTSVQVWVDSRGFVFSPPILNEHGSGLADADKLALEIAREARFEPEESSGPGRVAAAAPDLTVGTMIFEWQTLPVTNSVPAEATP